MTVGFAMNHRCDAPSTMSRAGRSDVAGSRMAQGFYMAHAVDGL